MKMYDYNELFTEINSLKDWKEVIIKLRGPHPTEDSEFMLCKLIDDVINTNIHMKKNKKDMFDMIYMENLYNLVVE